MSLTNLNTGAIIHYVKYLNISQTCWIQTSQLFNF